MTGNAQPDQAAVLLRSGATGGSYGWLRSSTLPTLRSDMGSRMKTTVEIPDPLLEEIRKLAARDGTTVRALVELGLRKVLAEKKRDAAFVLRDGSFKGRGLQPGVKDASWERLLEMAYEGRGT